MNKGSSYIQTHPSAVWTIQNPLGRYPAATKIIVDNEEWETDIEVSNDLSTIVLTFATPQKGRAEFL